MCIYEWKCLTLGFECNLRSVSFSWGNQQEPLREDTFVQSNIVVKIMH